MINQTYITAYCHIQNGVVVINGINDLEVKNSSTATDFLTTLYKHYEFGYPKFHKMDLLCKLGFIASELLINQNKVTKNYAADEIGIIVANSASSLEVDTIHQKSIQHKNDYFPSPSIFVYTLPNIVIGEIAIRNSIKGENTFFVSQYFDSNFMCNYINGLLNGGKIKCIIAGWIDFYEDEYKAFLYTVELDKKGASLEHSAEKLKELFEQN
jgi:hypothetical protein